jgi:hypothetical protein
VPKGVFIVESGPADVAKEGAYNEWYSNVHIPEILEIDGFASAERYQLHDPEGTEGPTYLAIYQIDADDVSAPIAELGARSAAGKMTSSDALRLDPPPRIKLFQRLD